MKGRSISKGVVLGLLVVALVIAGSAWRLGSKLVEPANHSVPLPVGFPAQIVSIPGAGHSIAGWWVDKDSESPVVLLLHGVRADRASMVSRAQLLMRHGFSVLLIDLQGHGETPGEAITLGFRESADVVAARDWIKRAAPGRRIGVIGCSLGGASVLLAPPPSGFDAVVLEAVYPRISGAVENRIRIRLGPLAPVLTPLLLMQLQPRLHIAVSDLEPIRSIGSLDAPVLVVAGSRDEHTNLAESRELFEAAAEPKSLWVVEGARHQDFLAYGPIGYEGHVVDFLAKALKPAITETVSVNFPIEGRHILPVSLGKALLEQCSRNTPGAVSAYWEPSETEIDNLEKELVRYMAAREKVGSERPPAGAYHRQYVGVISYGIRLIYGNFYLPGFGDPGTTRPMMICDGGPSLWGVVFDPKTNTFSDMEFNGEA
jgi:uncharacterized protein